MRRENEEPSVVMFLRSHIHLSLIIIRSVMEDELVLLVIYKHILDIPT